MLKNRGFVVSSSYIATILKGRYNLEVEKNSSYKWHRSEIFNADIPVVTGFTNEKGRYYVFRKELFSEQC